MVTIKATDFGGSIVVLAGSGEEAAEMSVDENCGGVLMVRDPARIAIAGLHIQLGNGELITRSSTGNSCSVGTGRPAQK